MNLNADQICRACSGEFLVPPVDTTVFAVSAKIDSRDVICGDMFVAIKGKNDDGHKYIMDVLEKKASVVICEKKPEAKCLKFAKDNYASIIQVKDSQKALIDVAIEWRKNIIGKVIAITGSVGKTTTKSLTYQTLSTKYQVSANKGNFNNELGLPITMCSSKFEDDFVITEMGMSAVGEIEALCKIAKPDWGVITNIGQAHIEFLGSQENIAKAKSELALSIPDNIGKLFLPTDDKYRDFIIDYAKLNNRNIEIIYFGGTQYHDDLDGPQVWYENAKIDNKGCANFTICIKDFWNSEEERHECKLNIPGKHNILNACAASAVALKADISISKVIDAFKAANTETGRDEILKSKGGFKIINDAYNANPQSMISSIETLSSIKCKGKKIAFLGDMFELGEFASQGHSIVGDAVAQNNIDLLICVGKLSKNIYKSAIEKGIDKSCAHYFIDEISATDFLNKNVNSNDVVLFKASNGMGFQKIVRDLVS